MQHLLPWLRDAVFACFCIAVLTAVGSWLVRTRRVSPFGALGRALRGATEPLIRPVEARLVRLGGNPVQAGLWLVVVVAVAGIVAIAVVQWAVESYWETAAALVAGPGATLAFLIAAVYRVLVLALIVRVVASWFGLFRYTRWLQPAYWLTDWIVEPLRRMLPAAGPFDL